MYQQYLDPILLHCMSSLGINKGMYSCTYRILKHCEYHPALHYPTFLAIVSKTWHEFLSKVTEWIGYRPILSHICSIRDKSDTCASQGICAKPSRTCFAAHVSCTDIIVLEKHIVFLLEKGRHNELNNVLDIHGVVQYALQNTKGDRKS